MESKHSSLYITFPEYLKQPDNGNKNFNDYLLDYFREKAAPLILKALDGQFGLLSRIANDLSTIHPELSKSMVVDQFIAAVDFMDDTESQYRSDVLKRWCLASINIISRLFLDKEGKIKTKYLATLINNEKLTTIEEVSHYLYGEPEIPSRIKDIANQIVGSAMHAVVELVVDDKKVLDSDVYRARVYGEPGEIRVTDFAKDLTFEVLNNSIKEDFYLCRLPLIQLYNSILIFLNDSLPPESQVSNLTGDLNSMYDRLIICSPIAGTQDYNTFFNCYLRMLTEFQDKLKEKNPTLINIISQCIFNFEECFNDLRDCPNRGQSRGERLSEFSLSTTRDIDRLRKISAEHVMNTFLLNVEKFIKKFTSEYSFKHSKEAKQFVGKLEQLMNNVSYQKSEIIPHLRAAIYKFTGSCNNPKSSTMKSLHKHNLFLYSSPSVNLEIETKGNSEVVDDRQLMNDGKPSNSRPQ